MNLMYTGLAAVYDRLMSDVDYKAWVDYLVGLLQTELPQTPRIQAVDCGCGTGSVTLRLLQSGLDVIGLDASADMLMSAGEKLRRRGFHKAPLICGDMRGFSLHRPVDAVISACDGVNYLLEDADAAAFFSAAYRALRPGGVLLFDISSAYKLQHVLAGHTFGEDLGDCAYLWQNTLDEDGRMLQMELSIFLRGADGRYDRREETHRQRVYETEELTRLLTAGGFGDINIFDAFTRNAPRSDSERIQFVARRSQDG